MSTKMEERAAQSAQMSVSHEKIMQRLQNLYSAEDGGLVGIGKSIGVKLQAPRTKISTLLVGNHSAGKSSFINWYLEETVQKTSVAMETNCITLVTSGRKRETLGGPATKQAFPHLADTIEAASLTTTIMTQVSTSRAKAFPLITFVDTPGLVDGQMKYSFDIERSLTALGAAVELVFVFFDPMGQALCKRTLDIVEKLQANSEGRATKVHYFLSKADSAGSDTDRQKVILQIAQNMCRRPALNSVAFDMPTIYIPDPDDPLANRCPNQIDDLCSVLDETVNSVVQNSLNSLKQDCQKLITTIDNKLKRNTIRTNRWFKDMTIGITCLFTALLLIVSTIVGFITESDDDLALHTRFFRSFYDIAFAALHLAGTPIGTMSVLWIYLLVLFTLVAVGLLKLFRRGPTLSTIEVKRLQRQRQAVQTALDNSYQQLYEQYLDQAVGPSTA
eukprot:m.35147 g.35147  ORF g.35147 m.35147 type:complete len:446 (-) comp12369_c0_seq2:136-1473(-)